MSVRTSADECKDKAEEHLTNLIISLQELVDPSTWGYEDYSKSFIESLEDDLHTLIAMRRRHFRTK